MLSSVSGALNGKKATSDGQCLSPSGHWLVAQAFAEQLGYAEAVSKIRHAATGALQPAAAEQLRVAVRAKDVMWRQFWVPPNWAFLYGNRQTQPSSRSHISGKPRWFPEDLNKSLSDLEKMEKKIWKELPRKETD